MGGHSFFQWSRCFDRKKVLDIPILFFCFGEIKTLKKMKTAQSVRANLKYKQFIFISPENVHQKINIKNNILVCGIPRADKLFINF
jgi:hypothetical protein